MKRLVMSVISTLLLSTPAALAQPASELITKATQCTSMATCQQVILSAAYPRDPEAIRIAADKIAALNTLKRGDRKAARALNDLGLAAFNKGNYGEAIRYLDQAAAADPADVEIVANLGYAYVRANQLDNADEILSAALLINPRRTSTWLPIAESAAARGNGDIAVRAILLGYEFSSARDKTRAFYENKAITETNSVLKDVYAKALAAIESTPLAASSSQNAATSSSQPSTPQSRVEVGPEIGGKFESAKVDTVAQVLNYTIFENDDGSQGELASKSYYPVDTKKCLYRRVTYDKNGQITALDSVIDLNKVEPKLIRVIPYSDGRIELQLSQSWTMVLDMGRAQFRQLYGNGSIFMQYQPSSLDLERVIRGWKLVFSKYCQGKVVNREF